MNFWLMTVFSDPLHWANPLLFLLLLGIPLGFYLQNKWEHRRRGIRFSIAHRLSGAPRGWDWRWWLWACRGACLFALVVVLARPQGELRRVERQSQALNIMLVLDLSESMRAYDIQPNRLHVAKEVLGQFIARRQNDRIGLVVFSGSSLTLMPLTWDHSVLGTVLADVSTDTVPMEGSALGDAMLIAANRLLSTREHEGSRVIILATDGVNNRGLDPLLAARVLAKKQIKLYTIGLGSSQPVPQWGADWRGNKVPMKDMFGRTLYWESPDEAGLQQLAQVGKGRYFRAQNRAQFEHILEEIDGLEKGVVKLRRSRIYREYYVWPLLMALLFLCLERVLSQTRFRRLLG